MIQKAKHLVSIHNEDEDKEGLDFEQLPDENILSDEVLVRLQEHQRVRTAVETLDEKCRELIKMLFYVAESPSYAEIAQKLGRPEGSIGPTRARCLKKLLQLLA